MQKISQHKVYQYGIRGMAIAIPRIFAIDNKISKGDTLEIYRTQIAGKDALVLIPKSSVEDNHHIERCDDDREVNPVYQPQAEKVFG